MTGPMRVKQLKWLCRRGMKELDVLLQKFLTEHEKQLIEGAWPELEDFLQCEDDRMWLWLQHPDKPDGARFHQLLCDIRYGTAGPH